MEGLRYTNAPRLQPNLLLGSLHLCFWLLFHPSAWRNHVARIDPDLAADFTLAALRSHHWRNPALRRLLTQAYLILPLISGLALGLFFLLRGQSTLQIVANTLHFTAIVLVMNLFFGLVVGVAAGIVGGVGIGVATAVTGVLFDFTVKNVAIGAFIGLAASINGSLLYNDFPNRFLSRRQHRHTPGRLIGSVTLGILIAALLILIRYGLELAGQRGGLTGETAYILARSLMVGVSFGLAIGWYQGRHSGLAAGVLIGLAYGLAHAVTNSAAPVTVRGLTSGALFGLSITATFVLPYVLAMHLGGVWAGAWAGALGSYGRHVGFAYVVQNGVMVWPNIPAGFIAVVLGLTVAWWRPVLFYPLTAAWNLLLYRAELRRNGRGGSHLLPWHSAFWDEGQFLPLYSLSDHLLLVQERDPAAGEAALAYLTASSQRGVAQAVRIELDARQLEQCAGVMALRAMHRHLGRDHFADTPVATLLHRFSQVSQDVDAALNQTTAYNQRQALSAVVERLEGLQRQLAQSNGRYAARFHPIAGRWQRIVADRIQELAAASETLQEINSPYVIGMPLAAQQEIFVGRREVSADIEQFLLSPHGCPPLYLYGQRRMGKTSLLNNLGRLLPSTILPLFVDLQGPASWASDHTGFLYSIAQAMITSARRQSNVVLPYLSREALASDPFIHFDEWLNEVEQVLASHSLTTALLALDEFEALDDALDKGRFDEGAVLGMLRHLIQHRPRFKLLLAGSHALEEFQRWASYLINVRLIHLDYLKEAEARQLIERPIQDFALRYQPEASQRVLDLTHGHPFLVQLLCHEIVTLKNSQAPAARRLAGLADVEAAVEKALAHGDLYFADIYYNRVDGTGLAILTWLAGQGEQAVVSRAALGEQVASPVLDQALALLLRRELVEVYNGGYRFQVELVRRWFSKFPGN